MIIVDYNIFLGCKHTELNTNVYEYMLLKAWKRELEGKLLKSFIHGNMSILLIFPFWCSLEIRLKKRTELSIEDATPRHRCCISLQFAKINIFIRKLLLFVR